jgi:flagellar motor protein MotB
MKVKVRFVLAGLVGFLFLIPASAQDQQRRSPIYQVTVIERTVKAVNYMYRSGPTPIDLRGTVLLPAAKGDANVESKTGRTEIDAHFAGMDSPQKFGTGYLTYVLWAISPDGHAKNLGEVIANGSDKGKLHVSTDLQAFGLIVTAEPYSAVRRPSDVVVMENVIRPDTTGKVIPIEAKYELLPRGEYTYTVPAGGRDATPGGPKVSTAQYEALLELYEAQNAVQIAQSLGADRYAPDVMGKANDLLRNAQQLNASHGDRTATVMAAREAAERAEDARMIALDRQHAEQVAQAQQQTNQERQLRLDAEARAQTARAEAQANQQMLDRERAARERAEADAANAASQAAAAQAAAAARVEAPPPAIHRDIVSPSQDAQKSALRTSLVQQMNSALPTLDTPRGLVVSVADSDFRGSALGRETEMSLARIATILRATPGLRVEVDGNSGDNSPADERLSTDRAMAVRDALIRGGFATEITARGLGAARPLVANTSPRGREENRRVEITISGDAIGTMPGWDRGYSVVRK